MCRTGPAMNASEVLPDLSVKARVTMGKPKKGGFPAMEPKTNYVKIQNNEIDNVTIAWGDSIVWVNKDETTHSLAPLGTDGKPDPANPWAELGPKGSDNANSVPTSFNWNEQQPPPKDPTIYQYGLIDHPTSKAKITVQIKV
jgi:plastocyanin